MHTKQAAADTKLHTTHQRSNNKDSKMSKKFLKITLSISIAMLLFQVVVLALAFSRPDLTPLISPFLSSILIATNVALSIVLIAKIRRYNLDAVKHRREVQQWWCNEPEDEEDRRERWADIYRDEIFRAQVKGHSPEIIKEWEDKLNALYPEPRDVQFARPFTREEKAKNWPEFDNDKDFGF
jgi:hypothetical protein